MGWTLKIQINNRNNEQKFIFSVLEAQSPAGSVSGEASLPGLQMPAF